MFVHFAKKDGGTIWIDPGWIGTIEDAGQGSSEIRLKNGTVHMLAGDPSVIIAQCLKAVFDWQKSMAKEMLQDTLGSPAAIVKDYFDAKFIQDILNKKILSERNWAYITYAFLVLELWLREEKYISAG